MTYTIGVMSGTSVDALDLALAMFEGDLLHCRHTLSHPIPKGIKNQIQTLIQAPQCSLQQLGELNSVIGSLIADAVLQLLNQANINAKQVTAIGSHGQTVFHHPHDTTPFSLQLGDPNVIAAKTGITTVADFRNKDMALGGQGAPLTPLYHEALFRTPSQNRMVVNIGGIANLTQLPADSSIAVTGFDSGPGNTLLDAWIAHHQNQDYDANGDWARTGQILPELLARLLQDTYFQRCAPKSTGREYFHMPWLEAHLHGDELAKDVQRTLVALTAQSIADAIRRHSLNDCEVIICGGGAHNRLLMEELEQRCRPDSVVSSQMFGHDPDWIEAMAFAWLAKQTIAKQALDYRRITGAKQPAILGGIYYP